jgi:hypothetical protein
MQAKRTYVKVFLALFSIFILSVFLASCSGGGSSGGGSGDGGGNYYTYSPSPTNTSTHSPGPGDPYYSPDPDYSPDPGSSPEPTSGDSITVDARTNCLNLNTTSEQVTQLLDEAGTYSVTVSNNANYSSGTLPIVCLYFDTSAHWKILNNGDSFSMGSAGWIKAFYVDNDIYDNSGGGTLTIKKSGSTYATMTLYAQTNCFNMNDISLVKVLADASGGTYSCSNTASYSSGSMPVLCVYFDTTSHWKLLSNGNSFSLGSSGWIKAFYIDNDTGDNSGKGTISRD